MCQFNRQFGWDFQHRGFAISYRQSLIFKVFPIIISSYGQCCHVTLGFRPRALQQYTKLHKTNPAIVSLHKCPYSIFLHIPQNIHTHQYYLYSNNTSIILPPHPLILHQQLPRTRPLPRNPAQRLPQKPQKKPLTIALESRHSIIQRYFRNLYVTLPVTYIHN